MRIKAENPGMLLFYRMGDFYELFFDDAKTVSRELQLTLTSRNRDAENPVPMCGVPWHAVESYLGQLIDKGYSVAICDQIEDPKQAKGIVKRAVTRVLTPGTVLEDSNLDTKSHNYLGAAFWDEAAKEGGFAWADISTGEWTGIFVHKQDAMWQWILKMLPRELLLHENTAPPDELSLQGIRIVKMPAVRFDLKKSIEALQHAQKVQDVSALGLGNKNALLRSCGAILAYVSQTQRCDKEHLKPFSPLNLSRRMLIDEVTERNLEIFSRLDGRKGKGTLRHILDETVTPMGSRLLEECLHHPWREPAPIQNIQKAVTFFFNNDTYRKRLRDALKKVFDLERLSTRISLNRASPRDFAALRNSLSALPGILSALNSEPVHQLPKPLQEVADAWDSLEEYSSLLDRALVENPPIAVTEGGLFRAGYNNELDRLLDMAEHGEQKLQHLLEGEQAAANLPKLKLGYNRVFGYYYELSRSGKASDSVPEHFIRRQTLANTERFTTAELKKLEEEIVSAEDKRNSLEYNLFKELRETVAAARSRILFTADLIAHLDYWQSLAEVARRHDWHMPEIDDSQDIFIKEGRHPVVEDVIGSGGFVPNTFRLDQTHRLCLLTGPNMAGKSTVLRQAAIICIMAQMGSMVPAKEARIGLVDRLFSRVGASDNLAKGQSTFMIEMMETARILRQATSRSLIILDEIGRGTSTYDGLALAWAVTEDLVRRKNGGIRTIFATHYHELTALDGFLPGVFTMNIAIREYNNEILFLHKLVPGPSDRSYGVEVARLAGVPNSVVRRAREILCEFEKTPQERLQIHPMPTALPGINISSKKEEPAQIPHPGEIQTEHPLIILLRELQPDTLTPLDALKTLTEWKLLWGQEKKHD